MNYSNIYNSLIERARSRQLVAGSYFERHHIVPRCLGGDNSLNNLVSLTAEEHYLAHQLLVKIHPGNSKLLSAAVLMTIHHTEKRMTNKLFGWLRREYAKSITGIKRSEETCKKISQNRKGKTSPEGLERIRETSRKRIITEQEREKRRIASTGKKHTEETKRKIAEANRGVPKSPEAIAKVAAANRGKKRGPRSDRVKEAIGNAHRGKVVSEETREKLRQAQLGRKYSEETKKRMSNSGKAKIFSDAHKKKLSEGAKKMHERRKLAKQNEQL
jgi:hypothetical protein